MIKGIQLFHFPIVQKMHMHNPAARAPHYAQPGSRGSMLHGNAQVDQSKTIQLGTLPSTDRAYPCLTYVGMNNNLPNVGISE